MSGMATVHFRYRGPFITESDLPGESKRDFAVPNYATGLRLSPNRWLIVYDTVDCRGADFWRSVMYQIRADAPDGRIVKSGFIARLEEVETPFTDRYPCWKGYGNASVFGMPCPASGAPAAPTAGLVAISYNSRIELMANGRLVQYLPTLCPHWPKDVPANEWFDTLARLGSPRLMRQYRFNPDADELVPVTPAEACPAVQPIRLRHDLQGVCNWGNPVRLDEQGLAWLEALADPTEDSLLVMRRYDFDAAAGLYRINDAVMSHRENPDFRAGEPSLARVGPDDWMVAARCFKNDGNTLLYRTSDPMAGLGPATPLATTYGQRMLYRFADGSIRLTLNHQKESPYQDRRNPLYCYRLDPATLQVVERSTVFDSRAAGFNLTVPFVDHTNLFEPHGPGIQLLTFRLIAEALVWNRPGMQAPTPEELRTGGLHCCEVTFNP